MSVLCLENVKVHFGGVRAVDGVSFALEPGQLCGVVGPNGSGKTTTINAITRTARLTSGTITFDGHNIGSLPPYQLRRIGLVRTFQGIRLVPELTVRDNIRLAAEQDGKRRQWLGRRSERHPSDAICDSLIDRFGLSEVRHEYPDSLPYGTQRRIEIVRALSCNPKLLLLDEPVAGMNQAERAEISQILKELHSEGLSMLIIEHDLKFLLNLSDTLIVLNFGKLLAQGAPHATAQLPAVQRAYLGGSVDRD
jgi:branched-chain amino acid transport system ATP-binding protein